MRHFLKFIPLAYRKRYKLKGIEEGFRGINRPHADEGEIMLVRVRFEET